MNIRSDKLAIDRIKLLIKKNALGESEPLDKYLKISAISIGTKESVDRNSGGGAVQNHARKNYIINQVSAFETLLKDVIMDKTFVWFENGFSELLKEKISLNDSYNIYKNSEITREALIAHFYSFQNIESISHVFSNLTNSDFLKGIGETETMPFFKREVEQLMKLDSLIPEWRKTLVEIFEIRNKAVHEPNLMDIVSKVKYKSYVELFGVLPFIIYDYCLEVTANLHTR
jgi:hypothetical protein